MLFACQLAQIGEAHGVQVPAAGSQQPRSQMAARFKEELALGRDRVGSSWPFDPEAPVARIIARRGAVGNPGAHGSGEAHAQVEADFARVGMSPEVKHTPYFITE